MSPILRWICKDWKIPVWSFVCLLFGRQSLPYLVQYLHGGNEQVAFKMSSGNSENSNYLRAYLRGCTLFSSSELISISKMSSVPAEEIWSSFLLSCLYFFLLLFFFFTEPGVNTVSVSPECGISEFAHVLSFSPDFKWPSVSLKNWSSVGIGDVAK